MFVFDPSTYHGKYTQYLSNDVRFLTENFIQSDYSILALFLQAFWTKSYYNEHVKPSMDNVL